MPRTRTIYNAELVYVGPSPSTGFHFVDTVGNVSLANTGTTSVAQLHRVQTLSYAAATPKREVYQFGELGAIDRIPVESPNVTVEMSYLTQSLRNERLLGFFISSGTNGVSTAISGILTKVSDDKNLFAKIVPEGQDAIDNTVTGFNIFGFGNMQVVSYNTEAAVGDFARTTVGFQGMNMKLDWGSGAVIPAINPSNGASITNVTYTVPTGVTDPAGTAPMNYSVIMPGDISLSIAGFNEGFIDTTDWKIQNYQLSFDLSRTPIQKLGSRFAVSREIDFPVNVNLRVNAIVGDYATGNLSENIKRNTPYNITVNLAKPAFSYGVAQADAGNPAVSYSVKGAYLDNQQYSLDIGGSKTVQLSFVCPLTGPQDITRGIFFSGVN